MRRTVYAGMAADILHAGHINLLRKAHKIGSVMVGLITDDAIAKYKGPPTVPYESRRAVLEAIIYVDQVVEQDAPSPVANILNLKPDIFIHGDDWVISDLSPIRTAIIEALATYGGVLKEIPYTEGISSTILKERMVKP